MQAIVLVGGEGTRLRPLTDTVPKPAVTLVDRPFLAYMVEWLGAHGVTEVVLACGSLPDRLREALGEGEHAGVALTYVVEPDRRGTAGAIRFAAEALGDRLDDSFLALNGDVLTNFDLGALVRSHEERGAQATIGLYEVDDAATFGLVACDAEGAVTSFTEKTGVPSATYNSRNGYWDGPDGDRLTDGQNRALFICNLQYPYDLSDPAAAGMYTADERAWAWNYQHTRLVPCLQLMGYPVKNRDDGYITSTPWWNPYDELTPTPSAEEWELIDARCPPSPYGPTR